jgi:hypothetical protein
MIQKSKKKLTKLTHKYHKRSPSFTRHGRLDFIIHKGNLMYNAQNHRQIGLPYMKFLKKRSKSRRRSKSRKR